MNMKNLIITGFAAILILPFTGCDKVDNPIKPAIELDTNLYPGNWFDYEFPTFSQNTNTQRNVMIEDYTGHRCPSCPAAADVAKVIEDANPENVFVVSVHASPTGLSNFQEIYANCNDAVNPGYKYCDILYCDEGLEMGFEFGNAGVGFFGNPNGNVNRKIFSGSEIFYYHTEWEGHTNTVLTENDLKVNIQAKSNYYPESNGVYLHTEIEFLEDLSSGNYSTVVYVVENELIGYQDVNGTDSAYYHHHNILRGCIDDLTWGQTIPGDYTKDSKVYFDYSYKLPTGITNNDYHFVIYVYDVDTYEVLQVIKHEF